MSLNSGDKLRSEKIEQEPEKESFLPRFGFRVIESKEIISYVGSLLVDQALNFLPLLKALYHHR